MLPLIVTVQNKNKTSTLEIGKEAFTIGRALDCDVHLNEHSISRVHAVVTVRDRKMWVEDRNSSNGTLLNGKLIPKGTPVEFFEGDELRIGTSGIGVFVNFSADVAGEVQFDSGFVTDINVNETDSVFDPKVFAHEEHVESDVLSEPVDTPLFPKEISMVQEDSPEDLSKYLSEALPEDLPEPPPNPPVLPESEVSIPKIPEPDFAAPSPQVTMPEKNSAEKVLQDAKKQAAQIVFDGEVLAERKAQAIYEKARKIQEQAESFYEAKVAEAHEKAGVVLEEYQEQGRQLIREARNVSEKLREEVDVYIDSLKKKAHLEANDVLAESRNQAEKLRKEVMSSMDVLKKNAKVEAEEILAEASRQADKLHEDAKVTALANVKKDNENLIRTAQEQAEAILAQAQKQLSESQKQLAGEKENLEKLIREADEAEARLLSAQMELDQALDEQISIADSLKKTHKKLEQLQAAQAVVVAEKDQINDSIQSLRADIQSLELKKSQLIQESEALIAKNEKAKKENDSLIASAQEEVAATLNKAQKSYLEWQGRLSLEQEKFKNLSDQTEQAQDKVSSIQADLESLLEKKYSLDQEIEKDELKLQYLQTAQNKSEENRKDLDEAAQSLTDQLKNLSAQIQEMESKKLYLMDQMEALAANNEKVKKENERLIVLAQEEADNILAKAQKQMADAQKQLSLENEKFENLMSNMNELQTKLMTAKLEYKRFVDQKSFVADEIQKDELKLEDLRRAQKESEDIRRTIEGSIQSMNEKHMSLSINIQDMEAKQLQTHKEYDSLRAHLIEKHEKEKLSMLKAEEERSEEMRLEFAKKMQKMEQDLVDSVQQRKEALVREIHGAVEKEVVQLVEASDWRKISDRVHAHIVDAFEDKVAAFSQSAATDEKPVDLLKRRTQEKYRWALGGLVFGVILFFSAEKVFEQMASDTSPMQTRVTNQAMERQADLEQRRFNPSQTDEIKETYVDSVIYTRDFTKIYLEQDYQQHLYKELAQYLLKTWRIDEEATLRALSAVNALVKELADQRGKIHPDFINEGVEKMRKLETETLLRLKEILGSEVRLESFRRFENNFYSEELQRRGMAQR